MTATFVIVLVVKFERPFCQFTLCNAISNSRFPMVTDIKTNRAKNVWSSIKPGTWSMEHSGTSHNYDEKDQQFGSGDAETT